MTWQPPRPQRVRSDSQQRRRHGLSPEQVDAMYVRQLGKCLICVRSVDRDRIVIDHDHRLAELHGHAAELGCRQCVRGLLCTPCNTMLGIAKDEPETLRRAATYIDMARRAAGY